MYLTRGIGYANGNLSEFAEFYRGAGLRARGLDLAQYALQDLDRARITVSDGVAAPRAEVPPVQRTGGDPAGLLADRPLSGASAAPPPACAAAAG